jgi:cysteinyl-tRNA synthetase
VRVDDTKMSKSLGNFFTLRDIFAKYDPEVVRFVIVRAHYRSPINYTDATLDDAKAALTRLYTALKGVSTEQVKIDWDNPYAKRFKEAMDDDFGTPEAAAVLFDLAHRINAGEKALAPLLRSLGGVLGILQRDSSAFLQGHYVLEAEPGAVRITGGEAKLHVSKSSKSIDNLIAQRNAARAAKNFADADRIRRELEADGVILEDGPSGTTWRRK